MRDETFLFVVDTDQYAGNFERQMVAYISGRCGECGVGREIAEAAEAEIARESSAIAEWLQDNVSGEPDDRGCCRPAMIWPTPGWFNDGMGAHWRDGADPAEVRARYEASVRAYYEGKRDGAQRCADAIARGPLRAPAYLSVGMWLGSEPPPDVVALLKTRALDFAREHHRSWGEREPLEIAGFRLVRRVVTFEDRPL